MFFIQINISCIVININISVRTIVTGSKKLCFSLVNTSLKIYIDNIMTIATNEKTVKVFLLFAIIFFV